MIHARSVRAVVYLEHVVPFEYFVSSIVHNNRLYINIILGHFDFSNLSKDGVLGKELFSMEHKNQLNR